MQGGSNGHVFRRHSGQNAVIIAGSGNVTFNNNITVTGLTNLNGDIDLGNGTSDTITATARFDSSLIPSTDSARDLGSNSLRWSNI